MTSNEQKMKMADNVLRCININVIVKSAQKQLLQNISRQSVIILSINGQVRLIFEKRIASKK